MKPRVVRPFEHLEGRSLEASPPLGKAIELQRNIITPPPKTGDRRRRETSLAKRVSISCTGDEKLLGTPLAVVDAVAVAVS